MTPKEKQLNDTIRFERLEKQLFIGKVTEVIGDQKTIELLKESKEVIQQIKSYDTKRKSI